MCCSNDGVEGGPGGRRRWASYRGAGRKQRHVIGLRDDVAMYSGGDRDRLRPQARVLQKRRSDAGILDIKMPAMKRCTDFRFRAAQTRTSRSAPAKKPAPRSLGERAFFCGPAGGRL